MLRIELIGIWKRVGLKMVMFMEGIKEIKREIY